MNGLTRESVCEDLSDIYATSVTGHGRNGS
jgi:hypothetical protein